jgi:hypothetical protein
MDDEDRRNGIEACPVNKPPIPVNWENFRVPNVTYV